VVTCGLGPGGFAEYSLDSRKSTGHPPLPGLLTPLSPFSPPEPSLVLSTSPSATRVSSSFGLQICLTSTSTTLAQILREVQKVLLPILHGIYCLSPHTLHHSTCPSFNSLASRLRGVIAAGLENGELALWDPSKILAGQGYAHPFLHICTRLTRISGPNLSSFETPPTLAPYAALISI
jgi:hypothetical protein